jgi:hypothetical protein
LLLHRECAWVQRRNHLSSTRPHDSYGDGLGDFTRADDKGSNRLIPEANRIGLFLVTAATSAIAYSEGNSHGKPLQVETAEFAFLPFVSSQCRDEPDLVSILCSLSDRTKEPNAIGRYPAFLRFRQGHCLIGRSRMPSLAMYFRILPAFSIHPKLN